MIVTSFLNSFIADPNVPVNCTHNQILYPAIQSKVSVKKMKNIFKGFAVTLHAYLPIIEVLRCKAVCRASVDECFVYFICTFSFTRNADS